MIKPKVKIFRYVQPDLADFNLNFVPTLGLLFIDGEFFCHTLEAAWLKNRKNSCIPVGKYKLVVNQSPKFGKGYQVQGVPDRTDILLHVGNNIEDTSGCILLGSHTGVIGDLDAVTNSYKTMIKFHLRLLWQNNIEFEIRKVCR